MSCVRIKLLYVACSKYIYFTTLPYGIYYHLFRSRKREIHQGLELFVVCCLLFVVWCLVFGVCCCSHINSHNQVRAHRTGILDAVTLERKNIPGTTQKQRTNRVPWKQLSTYPPPPRARYSTRCLPGRWKPDVLRPGRVLRQREVPHFFFSAVPRFESLRHVLTPQKLI